MLISIHDARPGMIISTDILLPDGCLLAKKEHVLTSELIISMLNRGLEEIEVKFNCSIDVILASDKMSASLAVESSYEGSAIPDESEIRSLLLEKGIVFGIDEQKIKDLVNDLSKGILPSAPVIIAEGLSPKNGEDGFLQFHFDTETSLKPQLNSDGSADYKSVNIVTSVVEGQHLVTLIPPKQGVAGKNVAGELIEARDGSAARFSSGQNTLIDPQNPEYLISTISGVVRFSDSVVKVDEGFVIPGDVDFSTGNINYEKTVSVNGDVKSGFSIQCGEDLQVNGTIEDCNLKISGNVLGKFGFVGQGKGIIEAGGDVNLGFMKNQTIKSCRNANIAKEAINCTIYATSSIYVHGNPRSVAGGALVASDKIVLNTVGNQSGVKTLLEIGLDLSLVKETEITEQQIKELEINLDKLEKSQEKYAQILALRKKLQPNEQILFGKLTETISKYKQQIRILEESKKKLDFSKAFIKIERLALPGTLFKFGERHLLVKEEIIGPKTIRLIGHEIRII